MKAIFAAYNQAYNEEIVLLLENLGQRGYTKWEDVGGRGTLDGEPHLGSHAWPTQNHALLAVVPDEKAGEILDALKKQDETYPDLGLRAYSWPVENAI